MDDQKLINAYLDYEPKSIVAELASVIGPRPTILMLRQMAGRNIHIPSKLSQFRFAMPLIIHEYAKGLVGEEKKKALKKLSKYYNLPVWKLKRIRQTRHIGNDE